MVNNISHWTHQPTTSSLNDQGLTPKTSNTMSKLKQKRELQTANNEPKSNTPQCISKPTKEQHKAKSHPTEKLNPQHGHNTQYSQSVTPTENAAAKEQQSLGYEQQKRQTQAQQLITNLTPQHMDAYLAIAEVALEWIVDP
jgi:excinuclease UvrABC helicase subunit UvrB